MPVRDCHSKENVFFVSRIRAITGSYTEDDLLFLLVLLGNVMVSSTTLFSAS
jgi:hypothetical protein